MRAHPVKKNTQPVIDKNTGKKITSKGGARKPTGKSAKKSAPTPGSPKSSSPNSSGKKKSVLKTNPDGSVSTEY
jgi:hypothetical protein